MKQKFELGDYVYAEDWCYGKIVYLTECYAEVYFDTLRGGDSMTFSLTELKHAETKTRKLNYGRGKEND